MKVSTRLKLTKEELEKTLASVTATAAGSADFRDGMRSGLQLAITILIRNIVAEIKEMRETEYI